jgi:hypothetical protein
MSNTDPRKTKGPTGVAERRNKTVMSSSVAYTHRDAPDVASRAVVAGNVAARANPNSVESRVARKGISESRVGNGLPPLSKDPPIMFGPDKKRK